MEQSGDEALIIVRSSWKNDFCFRVSEIIRGKVYGTEYLNGRPYRKTNFAIDKEEWIIYTGPSKEKIREGIRWIWHTSNVNLDTVKIIAITFVGRNLYCLNHRLSSWDKKLLLLFLKYFKIFHRIAPNHLTNKRSICYTTFYSHSRAHNWISEMKHKAAAERDCGCAAPIAESASGAEKADIEGFWIAEPVHSFIKDIARDHLPLIWCAVYRLFLSL